MDVICDTNIWYELGQKTIEKPKEVRLIATWNNIIEIGFSHKGIKERIDEDLVIKAANAILELSDEIIEDDPFTFMANQFNVEEKFNTISSKKILEYIVENGLPSSSSFQENENTYNLFLDMKGEFAKRLNDSKLNFRKDISSKSEKEQFKNADEEYLIGQATGIILDLNKYLMKEHSREFKFIDKKDFVSMIDDVKDKFELLVNAKWFFLKKFYLDKSMVVQPNDYFDLLNFAYVKKGQKYWTKEKRWIVIAKENNLCDYLFDESTI